MVNPFIHCTPGSLGLIRQGLHGLVEYFVCSYVRYTTVLFTDPPFGGVRAWGLASLDGEGAIAFILHLLGLKGKVRRKLRWVNSGINRFLYFLAAEYFFFSFKGKLYFLKCMKPVSAFNDHKN